MIVGTSGIENTSIENARLREQALTEKNSLSLAAVNKKTVEHRSERIVESIKPLTPMP